LPTVVIIQQSLLRYRGAFFQELRDQLAASGIDLRLIEARPREQNDRGDELELSWAESAPARLIPLLGREAVWQRVLGVAAEADLVIVEQASRLLINYVLLARQMVGGTKLAYWGHGREFDTEQPDPLGTRLKEMTSKRVHWWFAYNELAAEAVRRLGYPADRITDVRNSTDTEHLRRLLDDGERYEQQAMLGRLGLRGGCVGVYMGAMDPVKRLDFLLEAAQRVRADVPDFELVLVGGGPESASVAERASQFNWMATCEPLFGREFAQLLSLAELILIPGGVGLTVVDSFAAGIPLITSSSGRHRPELSYMTSGSDGLIVDDGGEASIYAAHVVELLRDDTRRRQLAQAARLTGDTLSVADMAGRFVDGIHMALELEGIDAVRPDRRRSRTSFRR
jgi:glycosyltransferase involved in cell wall biosynthesis